MNCADIFCSSKDNDAAYLTVGKETEVRKIDRKALGHFGFKALYKAST